MYALLVLQQMIAAATHFAAKFANQGAEPFTIVFVRGAMTVCAFALWFAPQWKTLPRLERRDIPLLLILGALNIPCNQVLFVTGLKYTIPPNAALAYALVPAFVLLIMVFLYKEKTTWQKILGIAIALAGTFTVLFERGIDVRSDFFLGNMLELCASFSWAWYSILGKRLATKYGALYATALTMASGMLWYAPIYPFLPATTPLLALNTATLLNITFLAIITSVFGYFLWYYALSHIPASNVAVFANLQPVMVTVFSVLVLSTQLSLLFVVGGVCVIVGVVITQRE